jgi:chromosome segregation ATPase
MSKDSGLSDVQSTLEKDGSQQATPAFMDFSNHIFKQLENKLLQIDKLKNRQKEVQDRILEAEKNKREYKAEVQKYRTELMELDTENKIITEKIHLLLANELQVLKDKQFSIQENIKENEHNKRLVKEKAQEHRSELVLLDAENKTINQELFGLLNEVHELQESITEIISQTHIFAESSNAENQDSQNT